MKKILCLIVIVAGIAIEKSSAQFLFGPQVGFNYATLTGTSDISLNAKPEWHAGLLFDLGLGKHFSLQPSLLYSRRGYKYDHYITESPTSDSTIVTTANVDAALGYIDIPVLLNIYFGDHRGFMINAGPQLSVLITDQSVATTTTTSNVNGVKTSEPETKTEVKFNNIDISLMAGIGYKLPKLLLVYLRASTSFGKVQTNNISGGPSNKEIIQDDKVGQSFMIEVGAALTFGGK